MANKNIVKVCKAEPLTQQQIEDAEIHIKKSLPTFNEENIEKMEEFYKDEAEKIFKALRISLPQGTLRQLFLIMLDNEHNLRRL